MEKGRYQYKVLGKKYKLQTTSPLSICLSKLSIVLTSSFILPKNVNVSPKDKNNLEKLSIRQIYLYEFGNNNNNNF
jgi:hypothetical protein